MRIHDSMVKVSNKKKKSGKRKINNKAADNFFLPKGVGASVEQVMLDLNEQGFDFESESDFLDAVLDSVTYKVTDGTTGSKLFPITLGDTTQGDYTFSVGRSQVTPTDATQTFPTKDGGVVGPASFSISAFHGTPHKVDKFSTEQIGTGEGAQAYGWGLYFAESKDVAQDYKESLSGGLKYLLRATPTSDINAFIGYRIIRNGFSEEDVNNEFDILEIAKPENFSYDKAKSGALDV